VKQLLLKKNNTAITIVIFLLIAACCSNVSAQENADGARADSPEIRQDSQNNYKIQTDEEEAEDENPFSVAQPSNSEINPKDKNPKENSATPPLEKKPTETAQPPQKDHIPQEQKNIDAASTPQNNYKTAVILQGLNKITARTSKLEVTLDKPIKFGNLIITLYACWKSPPEEEPESKALLEMWEEVPGEIRKKVFKGWMFASSPLLSAPEHPIYDITVAECSGEPFVAKKNTSVKEKASAAASKPASENK